MKVDSYKHIIFFVIIISLIVLGAHLWSDRNKLAAQAPSQTNPYKMPIIAPAKDNKETTIQYYNPEEWGPIVGPETSDGAILYDPDDWEPYVEDREDSAAKKKRPTPTQADCVLKHAGRTQSRLAIRMIIKACHGGYSREICDCITDNMPGAENDLAAKAINKACHDKHRSDK